jgi:hypothetical protein
MRTKARNWGGYRIILLAAAMALMTTLVATAQNPVKSSLPSLVVTPSTAVSFSGPPGGPFSPSVFQYQLSASSGTVKFVIATPAWLTASPSSGVTDTNGVTITLKVNESASRLPQGTYGPAAGFRNVTNGRGNATKRAALIIQVPSASASPFVGPPPQGRRTLPHKPPQPTHSPSIGALLVTPTEPVMFSGPGDGPIYPTFFQFRVSATTGTINYTIETPAWLSVGVNFGTTDTGGRTVTVLVDKAASHELQPGTYGENIVITNVTSGRDRIVRPVVLRIHPRPQP